MTLALTSSVTAMDIGLTTYFLGTGGTEPYVYSVEPGGAGGTIDPDTGLYSSPLIPNFDPKFSVDVIKVTDDDANVATKQILIGNALILFCDILKNELALDDNHVYLWDQKINQPNDSGLYIAVGVQKCKPFANTNFPDGSGAGVDAIQSVNMMATLSLDIISRSNQALFRKEEVIMALNSTYAQSQQELNSFSIGKLPAGAQFTNLSVIDGAAIPYRFNIAINLQYFVRKIKAVPYFDDFAAAEITTEP